METNYNDFNLWDQFTKTGSIEDYIKFKSTTDNNSQEFLKEISKIVLCTLIIDDLKIQ